MTVLTVPDDKGKYWPTLGPQICDFIEKYLVFGPGDLRGMPAKLDEDKRALVWRMYEVFPYHHPMAGRRRFKSVDISLAKGLAKTEFGAWIAACELHPEAPVRFNGWTKRDHEPIGGPVRDPYIPMVAYTEEQSDELCYGTLKCILEEGPLKDDFDIGLERIMRKNGDGKCVSLASAPQARDGARTTFQVSDETHWWVMPRHIQAHKTMQANLAKRKEADPWGLEITTAPELGAGSIAEQRMEYAQAIKDGRIKDARFFFYHRQADESHKLDTIEDIREAVIEASGPAAAGKKAWRDVESIVELFRDPNADIALLDRLYCNRLVKQSLKAFDAEEWKALHRKDNPVKPGDMITLGFDGSIFHDGTALVATHILTGYQWPVGIWECPYGKKDWKVPEEEVDAAVDEAFKEYKVWRMYADPPYWQSWLATWAGRYGKDNVIEWWTNRRKQMSYALEAFETGIKTKEISHGGSAAVGRHIANSFRSNLKQKDEDTGKFLWLIHKERPDSPNKIDAAMASVLSWQARMDAVKLGIGKRSIYETREPLVYDL